MSKKYLFRSNFHVVSHIGENSWLNEESNVAPSLSTAFQFGTLAFARFNERQNALKDLIINLWSLLGAAVKRIADGALTGQLNGTSNKCWTVEKNVVIVHWTTSFVCFDLPS